MLIWEPFHYKQTHNYILPWKYPYHIDVEKRNFLYYSLLLHNYPINNLPLNQETQPTCLLVKRYRFNGIVYCRMV